MSTKSIRQCQCEKCQQEGDHTGRKIHHQINVVMSRLDEQQRRLVRRSRSKSARSWWSSIGEQVHRPG